MRDLPTTWKASSHTLAKHAILREYLNAWLPILSRYSELARRKNREVLFIDGFAGPGEYTGKEPGSPVIALTAALDHTLRLPVPVRLIFVEAREDRFQHLQRILTRLKKQIDSSPNVVLVEPRLGDCDEELTKLLLSYERQGIKFGPAFVFLDQSGYSSVSSDLIRRILRYPQCEVFALLEYRDMDRFISDRSKHPGITRAFGGEEWRKCLRLSGRRREQCMCDAYLKALKEKAKARYVKYFVMFDSRERLLYWLFFCTNHLRGLEEMKRAMWKVDKEGTFRCSDKDDPKQGSFLDAYDQEWLAAQLHERLSGRTLKVREVKEFVLTETPMYLFKRALAVMERAKKLEVVKAPPSRRRSSFGGDDIVIRFS